MGCFTGVETNKKMNLLLTVSLALLGAAVAEPGYYHHGYGGYGGYGHHGYGYGKREAEPTAVAEADAEPGYSHHGYSHGYGHGYGYGKREAAPGYYHHGYGYGGYGHGY